MNLWGSVWGDENFLETLLVSLPLYCTCTLDSKLE